MAVSSVVTGNAIEGGGQGDVIVRFEVTSGIQQFPVGASGLEPALNFTSTTLQRFVNIAYINNWANDSRNQLRVFTTTEVDRLETKLEAEIARLEVGDPEEIKRIVEEWMSENFEDITDFVSQSWFDAEKFARESFVTAAVDDLERDITGRHYVTTDTLNNRGYATESFVLTEIQQHVPDMPTLDEMTGVSGETSGILMRGPYGGWVLGPYQDVGVSGDQGPLVTLEDIADGQHLTWVGDRWGVAFAVASIGAEQPSEPKHGMLWIDTSE